MFVLLRLLGIKAFNIHICLKPKFDIFGIDLIKMQILKSFLLTNK